MPLNSSKIARNSIFLYLRMAMILVVTLITSRIVLKALGVEDYGIYNLVGGITATFNLILGILTDATQRFITFEAGKGKDGNVLHVFSTSVFLHIAIAALILILAEPTGWWLINNKLVIPSGRLIAAFSAFQFTLLSFLVVVVTAPFNALIIANERMDAFAAISVIDAGMRLAAAFTVKFIVHTDKLILYSILLATTQIVVCLMYYIFCRVKFEESRIRFRKDLHLIAEMGGFAGWTVFGNLSYVCCTHGMTLLLGAFFAPVVSAAKGIAFQIQGAVASFVRNFQIAVNPQIVKNYSSGDLDDVTSLVFRSSKFSYYLLLIPLIPLIFETDKLLGLWLGEYPNYTVAFVRFTLVSQLLVALRNPLEMAVKASGKIRSFEIAVGMTGILALPVSYICLKTGMSPVAVFSVLVAVDTVSLTISIESARRKLAFPIQEYVRNVLLGAGLTTIVSLILPICVHFTMNPGWGRFLVQLFASTSLSLSAIYLLGLSPDERVFLKGKLTVLLRERRKN